MRKMALTELESKNDYQELNIALYKIQYTT